MRGATAMSRSQGASDSISIHAPHAGCDRVCARYLVMPQISIHAPHAGCDTPQSPARSKAPHFNPRTPCRVRPGQGSRSASPRQFQSTHPMRGATTRRPSSRLPRAISIHAPHAGCDKSLRHRGNLLLYFNPRTPCGVRPAAFGTSCAGAAFQSTHPMRGATPRAHYSKKTSEISIHAPHAGCDAVRRSAPT